MLLHGYLWFAVHDRREHALSSRHKSVTISEIVWQKDKAFQIIRIDIKFAFIDGMFQPALLLSLSWITCVHILQISLWFVLTVVVEMIRSYQKYFCKQCKK
jgi:hypothetical protein